MRKEQLPALKGLKLGMTFEEVRAKWPDAEAPTWQNKSSVRLVGDGADATGELKFYKGKLYQFTIFYSEFAGGLKGIAFRKKMEDFLGLKDEEREIGGLLADTDWSCNGFSVHTGADADTYQYVVSDSTIRIKDTDASRQMKDEERREEAQREQEKADQFKP